MDGNHVIRKLGLLLGVAALGALVTSCGGDDSSSPTPTPTGTATPTPTPTSAATFSLTSSFSSNSSNAGYIFAYFTPGAGGVETFSDSARVNGSNSFAFVASPDSVTFGFPDLTNPVVFNAADFVNVTATERRYVSGDEALTMLLPFQNAMQVTYQINNQDFTRGTVDGKLRSQRVGLFFNPVTTTSDITTTLSYTGQAQVAGGDPDVTQANVLTSAQASITVTPGATDDVVAGTILIFQTINNVQTLVATIAINTNLNASNGFSGTITDATNSLTGQYAGVLAGPDRDEIVIVFAATDDDATDTDNTKYIGSFIGN